MQNNYFTPPCAKTTSFIKGVNAEALALGFFQKKGYKCLEKRFKTPWGEIDIILQNPSGGLIFLEVKYRKKLTQALCSLQHKQQRRIANAAAFFLQQNPWGMWKNIQMDLFIISPDFRNPLQYEFSHFSNIWLPDEN